MTKFVLILYICSTLTGTCNNGQIPGLEYDNHYDCALAGYKFASATLKDMDKELVNTHRAAVKFECKAVTIIIPKEKPQV